MWQTTFFTATGWERSVCFHSCSFLPSWFWCVLKFASFDEDRFGVCFWHWASLIDVTWALTHHWRLSFSLSPLNQGSELPFPVTEVKDSPGFPLPVPADLYQASNNPCPSSLWAGWSLKKDSEERSYWYERVTLRSTYELFVKNTS